MNEIEKYAVELVHEGAAHCAQDDLNEGDEPLDENDWRIACDLGREMARAIKDNPESFLGWYLSTTGQEVEI